MYVVGKLCYKIPHRNVFSHLKPRGNNHTKLSSLFPKFNFSCANFHLRPCEPNKFHQFSYPRW